LNLMPAKRSENDTDNCYWMLTLSVRRQMRAREKANAAGSNAPNPEIC